MKRYPVRIITRESPLAMWQARFVRERLSQHHPGLDIEIAGIKSEADRFLDKPLEEMGGKGAFVKELELALLDETADLAVHSMKDVPVQLPDQLCLAAILHREDVRDVFVSDDFESLDSLPANACVGTSSLRRHCQIKARRPDLEIADIRGNVGTRISRMQSGEYAALVLAAAGVKRLGLQGLIKEYFDTSVILPAIGQGALGVETRKNDERILDVVRVLNDPGSHTCVSAERAFNRILNGGCHAPVAAHAQLVEEMLVLRGMVGSLDGTELLHARINGNADAAISLGESLARDLLERGAGRILSEAGNAAR